MAWWMDLPGSLTSGDIHNLESVEAVTQPDNRQMAGPRTDGLDMWQGLDGRMIDESRFSYSSSRFFDGL